MIELPDCITLEDPSAPVTILRVRHPAVSARVSLHGAQVLEWTPSGQQVSVLYLSPAATFAPGRAIRGGIPLCWPWFGAPANDPSLPAHGFARIQTWLLTRASVAGSGVELELARTSDESTHAFWPHDFTCRLHLRLGQSLDLELTTENTGDKAFAMTEALHTYIRVGDITQTTLAGLDGAGYLDTTGVPARRVQTGDIRFREEVDRQYASAGTITVTDPLLQRTVAVFKSGSQTTVVWNPWIDKAARLPDLPDDDWRHFVCVEAANAGEGASVWLEPGAKHRLQTVLSLGALAGAGG